MNSTLQQFLLENDFALQPQLPDLHKLNEIYRFRSSMLHLFINDSEKYPPAFRKYLLTYSDRPGHVEYIFSFVTGNPDDVIEQFKYAGFDKLKAML